jgi:DNA-directed RNA polymerase specialized sigma24 family protein
MQPLRLPNLPVLRRRSPLTPGDELDRDLARGMLDGSREALDRFLDRHLGPLTLYLDRRLGPGHEEQISIVVQATMRDAFGFLSSYAGGTATVPMRLRLIRAAERHLRKLPAKQEPSASQAEAEAHTWGNLAWLRQLYPKLTRREQMALSLAIFERLDPREMGHAMGTRPARAMRTLRGALLKVSKRILSGEGQIS